jgi:hypothetical protein
MLDLGNLANRFNLGIKNAKSMLEKWRQIAAGEVTVFIDCRRENRPTMLSEPLWVVRTATKKGNTKWRAGNDHWERR